MLRRRAPLPLLLTFVTTLATALVTALVVPGIAPAGAAPKENYSYLAYSGGTMIRAVGTTISSDLTAQATISGTQMPNSHSSKVATVDVDKLVDIGAVETSTSSKRLGSTGAQITSRARTAEVSLLNGLIRAKAIESSTTTVGTPRRLEASSQTRFVDLKILGVKLPVDIPQNYQVQIPGVANVVINAHQSGQRDGVSTSYGYALAIVLLKPRGKAPAGATIMVNPTYVTMGFPVPPTNPALGGYAFGTEAVIKATSKVSGEIGRTGQSVTPPNGTGGRKVMNRTADVNIPKILHVGAVTSSTTAESDPGRGEITNVASIAGLDVLNGLVTADALSVTAKSRLRGTRFSSAEAFRFVDLEVAGQPIKVGVGRNTKIEIEGVAVVTLNQRIRGSYSNKVRGIHVKLLSPRSGLEVGAEIEVAVAATHVWG